MIKWDMVKTPSYKLYKEVEEHNKRAKFNRASAFKEEADPMFFKAQRGEDDISLEDWEAKVQEIRDRYPYRVYEGEVPPPYVWDDEE